MKRLFLVGSLFVFLISSVMMGITLTMQQVRKRGLAEIAVTYLDLKEPITNALHTIPGGILFEKPLLQQVDKAKQQLLKKQDWIQFLNTTGMVFYQHVVGDKEEMPNLNSEFTELLVSNQQEFFHDTTLSVTQQDLLLHILTHQLSLDTYVQKLAEDTREALSYPVLLCLDLLYVSMRPVMLPITLGMMAVSFLFIMLLSVLRYLAVRRVGVILLITAVLYLITGYMLPLFLHIPLLHATALFQDVFHQLCRLGWWYLGSSICILLLSIILQRCSRKQKSLQRIR